MLLSTSITTTSSIDVRGIATALAEAVEKGSEKFKELVDQLKTQQGFTSELKADNLKTALENPEVTGAITALVKTEFGITNPNVEVTKGPDGDTNKVTVEIKKDGTEPTSQGTPVQGSAKVTVTKGGTEETADSRDSLTHTVEIDVKKPRLSHKLWV